jgi:hypothetical protein
MREMMISPAGREVMLASALRQLAEAWAERDALQARLDELQAGSPDGSPAPPCTQGDDEQKVTTG